MSGTPFLFFFFYFFKGYEGLLVQSLVFNYVDRMWILGVELFNGWWRLGMFVSIR
jgi:hypothetical protein